MAPTAWFFGGGAVFTLEPLWGVIGVEELGTSDARRCFQAATTKAGIPSLR
jgi:hypothetical protein